ncbi:hypothetical protein MTR67_000949 [Solanum verrucosum]|uniref:Uncharacterized protein n=1 Tax=Solanum verrucosum TaxID=315347 RepID=A0AAF0PTB4_SOLVR|nr:hypothetical protein MTR67_000949 [Solanum verrucosum]
MKVAAQLKRRNTYSEISSILQNSTLAVPKQPTSSWCSSRVPKQVALTIREPLPVVQKAARPQLFVSTSDNNKKKGKDLCTSSVISETGSVSNTSNQALQIQNTIPTKGPHKSYNTVMSSLPQYWCSLYL